jgi:hypothetical protein
MESNLADSPTTRFNGFLVPDVDFNPRLEGLGIHGLRINSQAGT